MNVALRRLERYARATGVKFERVDRHRGWQKLGLPDTRGFSPHLRRVCVFAEDAGSFPRASDVAEGRATLDDLDVDQLWLLHDLAHVVWYDLASTTFGVDRWRERDFFVEQHLASEAFAVLLLDYHVLSRTKHHGLAVELDAASWSDLRRRVRELPELESATMVHALVEQYLRGESELFTRDFAAASESGRAVVDAADLATIARWRDHERSYSDKQRWYVLLWWSDLVGEPAAAERAVVEGSTVAEPLQAALRLFTRDEEPAFEEHVARVAKRLRNVRNLFSALPKYRAPRERHDFRFTDATAIEPERVAQRLRRADTPRAEELFLLWQVLARSTPQRLTTGERNAVATLARSVQTLEPSTAAWKVVRSIGERLLVEERWTPDQRGLAAFFLP